MGARKSSVVILGAAVAVFSAFACGRGPDCLEGQKCLGGYNINDGVPDGGGNGDNPPPPPLCTTVGKPHIGLGGDDISAKTDGLVGGDRVRAKPYSALVTEYSRVLGAKNHPTLIDQSGGTFGIAPDRWYLEPLASAVFLNTAFNVAFEGCLKMTGDLPGGTADPKYATAPTAESAKAVCTDWTRRFWSREATPGEIEACVAAVLETDKETYGRPSVDESTRDMTPKRRWAYACASVLSSTGFLMY